MWQALRDDQRNVVMLFVGAEPANFVHNGREQLARWKGPVAAQGFHQALFTELFAVRAKGFGDAVGVQGEGVSGIELAFFDLALPLLEGAKNCRSGAEPIEGIIGAKEQCREMAAIDVAKAASRVVIFGEEKRGKGTA